MRSHVVVKTLLVSTVAAACLTGLTGTAVAAPPLIEIGYNSAPFGIEFRGVARTVSDPRQAFFTPYKYNPVIGPQNPPSPTANLFAPDPVLYDNSWYVFHSGARDPQQATDHIYLSTTTDLTNITGLPPSATVVDSGVYTGVDDPDVVVRTGTWFMALTTSFEGHTSCSILASNRPSGWPALADRRYEINIASPDFEVANCARPSLIWDAARVRWELYFDADLCPPGNNTCSNRQGLVAYSDEASPHNFTLAASLGDKADLDVKQVPGGYIGAWRANAQSSSYAWTIHYGFSTDGVTFTDANNMIVQRVANGDRTMLGRDWSCGTDSPAFAMNGNTIAAVLYAVDSSTADPGCAGKNRHTIAIAYPTSRVTLWSGPDIHLVYSMTTGTNTEWVYETDPYPTTQVEVADAPGQPLRINAPFTCRQNWTYALLPPGGVTVLPRVAATAETTIGGLATPDKGIDGLPTTFYSSKRDGGGAPTNWFQVDTGAVQFVNRVVLLPRAFGYGFPVSFSFSTSVNGIAWTPVRNQSYTGFPNPGRAPTTFIFDTRVMARYVRLTATALGVDDHGDHYLQVAEMYPDLDASQ